MNEKIKLFFLFMLGFLFLIPTVVFAAKNSSVSISYSGERVISSDIQENNQTYSSVSEGTSALLVSGGTSILQNVNVSKSGDASGDNADFYGINAAILTYNGANLTIKGGSISTNGSHANGLFAYGDGIINVEDVSIQTSSNNSGGIMVAGGGSIYASDLIIETQGSSSAPIRSDRGGGTIHVDGGTYTSNGVGSPAIYSTADITVCRAKLVSNVSSGVVIEGDNSITLEEVELEDSNTKSNTKGEEANYKNIFIYQSTSGDANEGTGVFVSKNSTITTHNGSTIFVTNTTADITLENNTILNDSEDGLFLKASSARWGKEGANGGDVSLKMIQQKAEGDIVLDEISTLSLSMSDGSVLIGAINHLNSAKNVHVSLSSDSVLSLTGDTYLSSLENESSDNQNIYLNGYKLFVDGSEITANNGTFDDSISITTNHSSMETNTWVLPIVVILLVVIVFVISMIFVIKRKKN